MAMAATLPLTACSGGQPEPLALASADGREPRARAASSKHPLSYAVVASAGAEELTVDAEVAAGFPTAYSIDDGAEPYLRDLHVLTSGKGWRSVDRVADRWQLPECAAGCRLRYRFALGEAAEALDNIEVAGRYGSATLSPPSAWLLKPLGQQSMPFRLELSTPRDTDFVSGMWPDESGRGIASDAKYLWRAPYSAFGRFRTHSFRRGGGRVDVAVTEDALPLTDAQLLRWLEHAADTVSAYFGRFPVPRVLVLVVQSPWGSVHGTQMGGGGAGIVMRVGPRAEPSDLVRDWKATHELAHLAVPELRRKHLWLTEGIATYVEAIARAQRGELPPEKVWGDFVWGMAKGLPAKGDRGLDNTHTWGRTYWGGALFCLLADIEIRRRTGGAKSLGDALRGALEAGGSAAVWWPVERYLEAGDEATGVPVLRELYERHANAPVRVDLKQLWKRLGVRGTRPDVTLTGDAEWAAVREGITARR